jgi:hypothetical protein
MKYFSVVETKPDPFKPSTVRFDDNFESKTTGFGDDDSWNTNQWNTQASNDPFASSTTPYDQKPQTDVRFN